MVEALSPHCEASAQLREAAQAQVADLASHQALEDGIDIVGSQHPRWHTHHTGSLKAWGAPHTQVGGGNYLPELIARYIMPGIKVHNSRDHIGTLQRTTVIAIDGSAGLTPRAPLALLDDAPWADNWCRNLLDGKPVTDYDEHNLTKAGIIEPHLWAELIKLRPHATTTTLIFADTTLGVGRYIARWSL